MLSPRLTNCSECADIPSLLKAIDCRLAELSANMYNNIVYMLNQPVPATAMVSLINYKRILTYKYFNADYASKFTVNNIASKVRKLTLNCNSKCGNDAPITTTTSTTTI